MCVIHAAKPNQEDDNTFSKIKHLVTNLPVVKVDLHGDKLVAVTANQKHT